MSLLQIHTEGFRKIFCIWMPVLWREQILPKNCFRKQGNSKSSKSNNSWSASNSLLVALTTATAVAKTAHAKESKKDSKLSLQETTDLLKPVGEFRASLFKRNGKRIPMISLSVRPAPDNPSIPVMSATVPIPPGRNAVDTWKSLTDPNESKTKDILHNDTSFRVHLQGGVPCFTFYRDEGFEQEDINNLIQFYIDLWNDSNLQNTQKKINAWSYSQDEQRKSKAIDKLKSLGVTVFEKDLSSSDLDWDCLAGYENVKKEIEGTLVQALKYPDKYDDVARCTRKHFETNRPRAVLLSGPPGTGKTLTARIIAHRSDKPMVHIAVESIVSKWYGESEQRIGQMFDACEELGGAIIFIDEIDAIAASRDTGNVNEATRRILSVILRKIEGFEGRTKSTLIAATNRMEDLDSALISRFDLSIPFQLPDKESRAAIFSLYAKQLSDSERLRLANLSEHMSGRDIKEVCEVAERRWASQLISNNVSSSAPDLDAYEASIIYRLESQSSIAIQPHRRSIASLA